MCKWSLSPTPSRAHEESKILVGRQTLQRIRSPYSIEMPRVLYIDPHGFRGTYAVH